MFKMTRRAAIVSLAALSLTAGAATPAFAQDKLTFTLATSGWPACLPVSMQRHTCLHV